MSKKNRAKWFNECRDTFIGSFTYRQVLSTDES